MRLSEAHIEQARTLKAEGMTAPAIAAKLSELYKIDVKPHHVYAALKTASGDGTDATKKKRAYT